jgi:hypothetical protein
MNLGFGRFRDTDQIFNVTVTRDPLSLSALNPPKGTPQSEGQESNSEAFGTGETMREHKEQQETVLFKLPTFTP